MTPSGGAGCGARGRRLVTVVLGRLGHHPAGTMTGARGASLDWDRFGAGNARGEAYDLSPRLAVHKIVRSGQVPGSMA